MDTEAQHGANEAADDPVLADDGYPSDAELVRIREWPLGTEPAEYADLLAYVRRRWKYADIGYWREDDGEYELATGGWSGNEEIVDALRDNRMFWLLCWQQSTHGGGYTFRLATAPEHEREGDE